MARTPGSVGDNALLTRENTDPLKAGRIRFGLVKRSKLFSRPCRYAGQFTGTTRVNSRTDNAFFREPFGQRPIFFCWLTGGLSRNYHVQKLSFVTVRLLHMGGCDQLGLLDRFQFDLEKSVCHVPVAILSTVVVMARKHSLSAHLKQSLFP
jgi:hypothetical protein